MRPETKLPTTLAIDAPDRLDRLTIVEDRFEVVATTKSPSLSVVLVSYRDDDAMTEAVGRLLSLPEVTQVIVVRNGVHPSAQTLSVGKPERYVEIKSEANLGFGRGFNLALPHIVGNVTISLNADVGITWGVLMRLRDLAASKDAIFAPHLYNDAGGEETGRRFYSLWRLALSRSPWRKQALAMESGEVDWAIGGCLAIKTSLLQCMQGFDERYFLYFEDVDLCWRAKENGWPTITISDRAFHAHGRASSRVNRTLWWHIKSAMKYFWAHPRAVVGLHPVAKLSGGSKGDS